MALQNGTTSLTHQPPLSKSCTGILISRRKSYQTHESVVDSGGRSSGWRSDRGCARINKSREDEYIVKVLVIGDVSIHHYSTSLTYAIEDNNQGPVFQHFVGNGKLAGYAIT